MSKLIFVDVDGTLVDYEGRLPLSAAEAVAEAHKAGNLVFLCTGRSMAEVPQELLDIGIDGVIGGGGTYIEDGGEVIFHAPLTAEQERTVVDWLRERGLEFFLETNEALFTSEHFLEDALPAARAYREGSLKPSLPDVAARQAFPPIVATLGVERPTDDPVEVVCAEPQVRSGSDLYRDDVNKVSFLLRTPQDFVDAKEAFPDLRVATWGGRGEDALFAEIAPGGIDKASAVRRLVEHRGANLKDTYGFGDAAADIPLIEICAVGVAMGNGGDEVREKADIVAGDVDRDGLISAFTELGLLSGSGEDR